MNVSVIIPWQRSDAPLLGATLEGVRTQRYDAGRIEVFVVEYGATPGSTYPDVPEALDVTIDAVAHPSPYAARNLASGRASGEVLLFTEPGCVPEPEWVAAHVAALRDAGATLSVGHIAPSRETWAVSTFLSYETVRDAWVFAGHSWRHMFGRPKNMAVMRSRFASHGPFVEVMRGADSKLVQLVAREVSPSQVRHAPLAVVRQIAVRGLPSCYRDRFRHGQALRVFQSAHAAPIALHHRAEIFRETLRQRGYGLISATALLAFLAAGIAAFRLGGASARFVRRGSHSAQ